MKTSSPVHRNITFAAIETSSTFHTAASTDSAELKESIEDWTIITDVVLALLLGHVLHVVRCDFLEELDIFVGMKLRHFVLVGRFGSLCIISNWVE